ncbi:MAG TPA: hypothetical protein VEJ18_15495 [Planctomycetota bacterium]|nr:hypothetical protein [Planctomycetota bacterium]
MANTQSSDGRMIDVQGMLRQASTRVSVDQLVKRGKKFVALLSEEKISELIHQAVRTISVKYGAASPAGVPAASVPQIAAESKQEFKELIQQYQANEKAKSELLASKETLDRELQSLREELANQKQLTPDEADALAVACFRDFEKELDRISGRVFENRKKLVLEKDGPEAQAELDQAEAVLKSMIARAAAAERERFAAAGGRDKQILLLEKRIEKLYAHIAALEKALHTLTTSKVFSSQQLQNVLRQLGLANDDKYREKKREMLKVVLDQNVDLRKKLREIAAA